MKKSLSTAVFTIILSCAANHSYGQNPPSGNQVNFSTFTAAPIGHYQHIWLHPNDVLTEPCDPGVVFFSESTNSLMYCQDNGGGIGMFIPVGEGVWEQVGDDIYPAATASNPNLRIGIGTTTPAESLDIAAGNNVLFNSNAGDFFWLSRRSNLGIGPTDVSSNNFYNNIMINLDDASSAIAPVRDSRFTITGGDMIVGALDHTHSGLSTPNGFSPVFTVAGDSDFVGAAYFHDDLVVDGSTSFNGNIDISGQITGDLDVDNLTADSITVGTIYVTGKGVVGSSTLHPTAEWFIYGDIGWTGSQIQSDGRFKTNVSPVSDGLKTISRLNPVTYQWKNFEADESGAIVLKDGVNPDVHLGLIAQDVYEVIPEAVQKPKDDSKALWSINYVELVPVLIQAVKEQASEVSALKNEIETLKQELKNLQSDR